MFHSKSMFFEQTQSRASFTLVELLVVIGILAILTAAVVIVLNPAELLKQSRDSKRTTDLASINNALKLLLTQNPDVNLGSASTVYLSLADSSSTCGSYSLPPLPSGWQYHCATTADFQKTDGNGWIPVSFSNGASQLPALPTDPQNTAAGLYYAYTSSNGRWKLASSFESTKYASRSVADGGFDPVQYEVGTGLTLAPFMRGLVGSWGFDETSGVTVYDESGNGNNGTLSGQFQRVSGGLAFSQASTTRINMGISPVFDFGTGDFAFSLSLKYGGYTSLGSSWNIVLSRGSDIGSIPAVFVGGISDNKLGMYVYTALGTRGAAMESPILGEKFSFVGIRQSGTIKLYINGVLQSNTGFNGNSVDVSENLWVGYDGGSNRFFNGEIYDLKIYNRALSALEAKMLYDAAK